MFLRCAQDDRGWRGSFAVLRMTGGGVGSFAVLRMTGGVEGDCFFRCGKKSCLGGFKSVFIIHRRRIPRAIVSS
jgi:hypothetical protein